MTTVRLRPGLSATKLVNDGIFTEARRGSLEAQALSTKYVSVHTRQQRTIRDVLLI